MFRITCEIKPNLIVLGEGIERNVRMTMREFGRFAKRAMKESSPKWKGRLKNSIDFKLEKRRDTLYVLVGTDLIYAEVMETGSGMRGRKVGGIPRKAWYPPVSAIEEWAESHGLNPYALAKVLGQKGIYSKDILRKTIDKLKKIGAISEEPVITEFNISYLKNYLKKVEGNLKSGASLL